MKKKLFSLVACFLLLYSAHGQSSDIKAADIPAIDSLDLGYTKSSFDFFEMFGRSPLLPFSNGIFMPQEKLWFYQVDSTLRLLYYALCFYDTSLYVIAQKANARYLVNLKRENTTWKQFVLLTLQEDANFVYPVGRGRFYMVTHDSVDKVFYYEGKRLLQELTVPEPVRELLPFGDGCFVLCFSNKLMLCQHGKKPQVLFTSPVRILSTVLRSDGGPILATPAGIYAVAKRNSAREIISTQHDGKLKLVDNDLYVLSNEKKKVYHYRLTF